MPKEKKWIQKRLDQLDPHSDYAEIWRLTSCYNYNDFVGNLIYCTVFPNFIVDEHGGKAIWREDGGKVVARAHNRLDQTEGYNLQWAWLGPDDERTRQSAENINRLHAYWATKYPGLWSNNDDYLYLMCFSATLQTRLRKLMGLPDISKKVKIAAHLFWQGMSKLFTAENGVAIHSIPDSYEGMLVYCKEFETRPREVTPSGHKAVVAMHEQFAWRFFHPSLQWLGHQVVRSMTPATTLRAVGIKQPAMLSKLIIPRLFGMMAAIQGVFGADPEQSVVEKREAGGEEGRRARRQEFARLDKAFAEHFRTRYGSDPAFSGCPFHANSRIASAPVDKPPAEVAAIEAVPFGGDNA